MLEIEAKVDKLISSGSMIQESSGISRSRVPPEFDIDEPLTALEARLSRIEDQIHSTESEGLQAENSSAVIQQPSAVMFAGSRGDQSMLLRVDDLEHSRDLLAESLGEVE